MISAKRVRYAYMPTFLVSVLLSYASANNLTVLSYVRYGEMLAKLATCIRTLAVALLAIPQNGKIENYYGKKLQIASCCIQGRLRFCGVTGSKNCKLYMQITRNADILYEGKIVFCNNIHSVACNSTEHDKKVLSKRKNICLNNNNFDQTGWAKNWTVLTSYSSCIQ